MKKYRRILAVLSVVGMLFVAFESGSVTETYGAEQTKTVEENRFWSVDFNNGYADLEEDPLFEEPNPEINPAAPRLVTESYKGQEFTALKLSKSTGDEVWTKDYYGASIFAGYTFNSALVLTNPFSALGENYFREDWYTERLDILNSRHKIKIRGKYQPLWEKGATINYWIKVPVAENCDDQGRIVGINSGLFTWELEDYQFQADDYAKYLSRKYDNNPGCDTLPDINQNTGKYDVGVSMVRFAKTHGAMQIDSDGSIYWVNDDSFGINLNSNATASFGQRAGMQNGDCFFMNSWQESQKGQSAKSALYLADSPYSAPGDWHMVTVTLMNDWVEFYMDGALVDVDENYSSRGGVALDMSESFKRFNKGTGMRYGYGSEKNMGNCAYGNYVCRLFLDWLTNPRTTFAIGGITVKNAQANMYNMATATDEISIAKIDMYSVVLGEEQIVSIYEEGIHPTEIVYGDVDLDKQITAKDALMVLRHVVKLEILEESLLQAADVNLDESITAEDALGILRYVVKLTDELPVGI